jgi:hypothetical protein
VIQGVRPDDFDNVLAGITYGWLHHNAALLLNTRVGPGTLLLTTFQFEAYGDDAYATRLLDSLLRFAMECRPSMELTVAEKVSHSS